MSKSEFRDQLRVEGVNARGYGIVPKMVMLDKKLTVEAKAIYAYFCSYAGAGDTAFPSVKKICDDLGIGRKRYYNHFKKLTEFGYVKTEQKRFDNGKFKHNVYTLTDKPIPCSQNNLTDQDVETNIENKPSYPSGRFRTTDNRTTDNDTSNNNISSYNQHSLKNQSIHLYKEDGLIDRKYKIYKQILKNIEINHVKNRYPDYYKSIDAAIKLLCFNDKNFIHNDTLISRELVLKEIKELKFIHIEWSILKMKEYMRNNVITNYNSYLSKIIYSSLSITNIDTQAKLIKNEYI